MKKTGALIMALVFALVLAGCPSSGGGGDPLVGLPTPPPQDPDTDTGQSGYPQYYAGLKGADYVYLLTLSNASTYILQYGDRNASGPSKTNSGTYTKTGATIRLSRGTNLTVTINSTGITNITGTITWGDGSSGAAPGVLTPLPMSVETGSTGTSSGSGTNR